MTERVAVTSLKQPLRIIERVIKDRQRVRSIQRLGTVCHGAIDGECIFQDKIRALDSALAVQRMEDGPIVIDITQEKLDEGNE